MIQNFFGGDGGVGGVSLSAPRLNIFTVGNMEVMICLSQGGLRCCFIFFSEFKIVDLIDRFDKRISVNNQILNPPHNDKHGKVDPFRSQL